MKVCEIVLITVVIFCGRVAVIRSNYVNEVYFKCSVRRITCDVGVALDSFNTSASAVVKLTRSTARGGGIMTML